jgi:hypothetical protein
LFAELHVALTVVNALKTAFAGCVVTAGFCVGHVPEPVNSYIPNCPKTELEKNVKIKRCMMIRALDFAGMDPRRIAALGWFIPVIVPDVAFCVKFFIFK